MDCLNLRKSNRTDPSFVLNLIDHNSFKAIRKYREYVTENQDMKDPIRESYHRIALGSEVNKGVRFCCYVPQL